MSTKVASVSSSLPAYDSPAPLHRPRYSTPLRREFLLRMLRAASSSSRRAGFASRRLRSRGLHWRGLPWPPTPGSTLSRYLLELRRQTTHSTLRRESLGLSNVAPTDGAVLRFAPRSRGDRRYGRPLGQFGLGNGRNRTLAADERRSLEKSDANAQPSRTDFAVPSRFR